MTMIKIYREVKRQERTNCRLEHRTVVRLEAALEPTTVKNGEQKEKLKRAIKGSNKNRYSSFRSW
jgi:hypothetical protein